MPDPITFQHYEVLAREDGTPWELGRGAMGVTYKALDTNLRVPVALKVIHPRQLDSELVAQRFVREARAAARLRHPHIAAVYHLGQQAQNWFYAMEFVAGDTAEALVKRDGPLPEPMVLTLAVQAARALNAAASLGLVHRDIKPSNLMLTHEGDEWQLKLIDFGLARTYDGDNTDEDLAAVTHSGFVGTPYYASPEQLEQHELDIRSDIYSLGVTLWFLLTGKVPFTGSVVSVLSQHLHKAPPFEQLDGVTSPATRELIARMLEKDPAARPQSALDLRRDLEACEEALPGTPARHLPAAPAPAAPKPDAEKATEPQAEPAPEAAAPPAFTPGEARFDAADTVAEFGFGQLCRARERSSGRDFAVLRLGPQRGFDETSLTQLSDTVERARGLEHPQVWRVHALEAEGDNLRAVLDWIDGYAWRDLLRRRRELAPAEAFPLLALAARGIDAILAAGMDRPDVSLAGLWCEAPAPDAPPTGVRVSPLGILRARSLDATWMGEGTLAGPSASGSEAGLTGAIRSLAEVAYETLGGVVTARGFPPLPALSEGANKVLRTALREPAQFASATALVEQLTSGHSEPAALRSPRTVAPPSIWPDAPAPPPPTPDEIVAPAIAEESAAESVDVASVALQTQASAEEASTAPRIPESKPQAEASAWAPPSRSSFGRVALAASLVLIAGAAAWFYTHRKPEQPGPSAPATRSPLAVERPATTPIATPATPMPIAAATPPPATPLPAATPAPATPIAVMPPAATPPPATPSPIELARIRLDKAEDFRRNKQWLNAADELLAVHRILPTASAARDGLEQLFREVRWYYTPRNNRLAEITKNQVEALVPAATKAARELQSPAAMLLLGQHYTPTDGPQALKWYEDAAPIAPKAHTRIGLLLARGNPTPAALSRAWQSFQTAAAAGDLDGRLALAECLYNGNIQRHPVAGLSRDEKRAVTILREVIEAGKQRGSARPYDEPTDTAESEPSTAKWLLATFYLDQEQKPAAEQSAWYRDEREKAKLDHATEMRRLLAEAAPDLPEAYGMLGVAVRQGLGGKKKDEPAAIKYWQEGIKNDDPGSMYYYARYLSERHPPDAIPADARKYAADAARKGYGPAIDYCKERKIPYKDKAPP